MPSNESIFSVHVEKMGTFGEAVGYDEDKRPYFIDHAVIGETLLVKGPKKPFGRVKKIKTLIPSPHFYTPPCSYFGRCGGCDWMDIKYESQLDIKEKTLRYLLNRNGWIADEQREIGRNSQSTQLFPTLYPIIPSPTIWNYRRRMRIHHDGRDIGFYAKKSRTLVPLSSCQVVHPKLNHFLAHPPKDLIYPKEGLMVGVSKDNEVTIGDGVFEQINLYQNEVLQNTVFHLCAIHGAKKILELYCGAGNLSFPLHRLDPTFENLLGFDINEAAIALAQKKKEEMGDSGRRFYFFSNKNLYQKNDFISSFINSYDTLIMDPPRKGVDFFHTDRRTIHGRQGNSFIKKHVLNIIYVSCNLHSFFDDIRYLKEDFSLVSIQPIDMFPHTHHIEIVAFFKRK